MQVIQMQTHRIPWMLWMNQAMRKLQTTLMKQTMQKCQTVPMNQMIQTILM